MADQVTQVLLSAQSPDPNVRKQAEDQLKSFQDSNYAHFLQTMATELSARDKPLESRKLAGLILKNALDAKDDARKADLQKKWLELDPNVKLGIKQNLLQTLAAGAPDAGHTAAQVIAKIAAIDLPARQWPELVQVLLNNMSSPDTVMKTCTLQALGYVCEEMAQQTVDILEQEQVNNVLTAVVQGMRKEEESNDVRFAATTALLNALDFAATNFENDAERNYIMTVTCESTLCPDIRVRQVAYECLVSICSTYYEKMPPYMTEIFNLTAKAIQGDDEQVALQAVELWSTLCEEEYEIQQDQEEGDSEIVHHFFVKQAMPHLVPILLETLCKQDDGQELDDSAWNISMAGGTCLGLVANVVRDDIVELVMPFVQLNIANQEDWHRREAAMFAFGSILEGPSPAKLAPLLQTGALDFILNTMKDTHPHVKDTTAWVVGRICEFLHGPNAEGSPVINKNNLATIIGTLLTTINEEPHVAAHVCTALHNLASGFEDESLDSTSPLSPYFNSIVQALFTAASRHADDNNRLRSAAYEALNEMVRCSAVDNQDTILQMIPVVLKQLDDTFALASSTAEDREKQSELQGLLCGVLQVIIQKLTAGDDTKAKLLTFADQLMQRFLQVFACRSATVHEEAMLAIGVLIYACGPDFIKYMQHFYPYLEMGLKNFQEYTVCSVTVGVVGDLCRALEDKLFAFCDGIVLHLLTALQSQELHRSVKPPILSCFGDVALAIGANFEKYQPYVIQMLQQAAQLSVQARTDDEDMIEYNNMLRAGILEAYSGMLQGFKSGPKSEAMRPFVDEILSFIESVYRDKEREDSVTRAAVGVMGDIAHVLPGVGTSFAKRPFYSEFLHECMQMQDDQALQDTARWAQTLIQSQVSKMG